MISFLLVDKNNSYLQNNKKKSEKARQDKIRMRGEDEECLE
jgi:hypothetical protein